MAYGSVAASILLCNALTFSRGGYLGVIIGLFFCIIIFWKKISKRYKIIMLIGTALVSLALLIPNPVSIRYYSIFNLHEGSNKGRIETWEKAAEVIENNPWLGVGIGNYPLAIKPAASYRDPIYAHNSYLDVAAETGILNALIWIGILISACINFLRKARNNLIYLAGAVSVVIFSVHSLVETPIYSPVVLSAFLIIISGSHMENRHEEIT
jgi:O-antigen ligase